MNSNPAQGFVVHLQSGVKAFICLSFQLEYFAALQPIKSVSKENPPLISEKSHRQERATKARRVGGGGLRRTILFAL